MKRVVVHIDRLALIGFRREDRTAIASGLEAGLERVFGAGVAGKQRSAWGDALRVSLGATPVGPGSKPQRVGENLARAFGEAIKQ